jgi:hypothetical protein
MAGVLINFDDILRLMRADASGLYRTPTRRSLPDFVSYLLGLPEMAMLMPRENRER